MGVTKFPFGISTAPTRDNLSELGMPDPTKYVSYWNDFITSRDYDATNAWILTQTGGTVAVTASAQSGLLTLTTGATSSNHAFLQLRGFPIMPTLRKTLFFKSRFKVDVLSNATIIMGLQNQDTTPIDFTDGLVFSRTGSSTALTAMSRKDSTTGAVEATGLGTLSADTFLTVGIYYDGRRSVEYWINNRKVSTLNIGASQEFLPDTNLSPSFGIQTTEAVAKIMTVDYIFVACER